MNQPRKAIFRIVARKAAVMVLMLATTAGAFATLGEGYRSEGPKDKNSLLYTTPTTRHTNFSLRSGYTYRGSQIFSSGVKKTQIRFNTTVTVQKGNTTYIVPLKKRTGLDKVKIQIGNQALRRN